MIDTETDITTAIKARNGQLIVKREQDTTPYLEANKRELNSHSDWRPYSGKGTMRKIAEIPNIIAEQWLKEGINVFSNDAEMQRKVRQKLDSNEYQYLRTMPGRVGVRKRHI